MTLRKIYGLSQKEVAKKLGISVHTVEAQGSIGLRKCIDYFRQQGYLTRFSK
jgi:DNA-directed RNA polymerase specialized sigma24 family protein